MAHITFTNRQDAAEITLAGPWLIGEATAIEREMKAAARPMQSAKITINGGDIADLDVSTAWLLHKWFDELKSKGAHLNLSGFQPNHMRLLDMVARQKESEESASKRVTQPGAVFRFFANIGRGLDNVKNGAVDFTAFSGRAFVAMSGVILRPQRLRFTSIVYHMNEVGVRAVPIVALMSFLVAIVTGYQGIVQLRQFGAEIYTIDLVAISMMRELAVLVTAIMVAGRSGSAFTAEIGVMKANEEVDALRTMGIDVFEVLVLPRVIAIMLIMPLLAAVADFASLLADYIVSIGLLNVSAAQFFERLQGISIRHFWLGIFKAPFFGFLIGMIGCLRGFQVKGAAEEVGKFTTRAVVDSIFLVITLDALFSIIFSQMGY